MSIDLRERIDFVPYPVLVLGRASFRLVSRDVTLVTQDDTSVGRGDRKRITANICFNRATRRWEGVLRSSLMQSAGGWTVARDEASATVLKESVLVCPLYGFKRGSIVMFSAGTYCTPI
jgi:hypothetical protein